MAKTSKIRLQIRMLPVLGPGKAQLLDSIDRLGSIAAAARAMGIAYPNAWKMMDSLNQHFREPLVVRVNSGKRGRGAELTESGRAALHIFRSVETRAKLMFENDVMAFEHLLNYRTEGAISHVSTSTSSA